MSVAMITTHSPEETKQLGEKMAALLQPGDVICLNGDLGAGKTAFSQGVARGLAVDSWVTSPTFTLINEYEGRLPLYHFDVYRLEGPAEMEDLGYEEYFYGDGVCLVEWAERVEEVLPQERLDISLTRDESSEEMRQIHFMPKGEHFQQLVEELMKLVRSGH
ncbi:MAG: tRNA (adenosine(37)-N6)-threonylcarbamoyltransferase complex ATPase subunit type 1 TsaE [Bacillota bacterium]|nr:tRNA (adenosine(37)-N6)-threonylcarbamoyltransferase complex ATPase subunit type 1 TsaE [Bacillota bacterium]